MSENKPLDPQISATVALLAVVTSLCKELARTKAIDVENVIAEVKEIYATADVQTGTEPHMLQSVLSIVEGAMRHGAEK